MDGFATFLADVEQWAWIAWLVLIAVFLDRCTAALAEPSPSSLLGILERRRQDRRRQEAAAAAAAGAPGLVIA